LFRKDRQCWWLNNIGFGASRATGWHRLGLAGFAAGCFQPLYGATNSGWTNAPAISVPALAVEWESNQIPAPKRVVRAAGCCRGSNSICVRLTGGAAPTPSKHRLAVRMSIRNRHVGSSATSPSGGPDVGGLWPQNVKLHPERKSRRKACYYRQHFCPGILRHPVKPNRFCPGAAASRCGKIASRQG